MQDKLSRAERRAPKPMLAVLLLLGALLAACGPAPESGAVQTEPPATATPAPAEAEAKATEATRGDVPAEIVTAYDEADSLQGLAAARFFRSVASPDFVHTTLFGQQEALNPYITQMQQHTYEEIDNKSQVLEAEQLENGDLRLHLAKQSSGIKRIDTSFGLSWKEPVGIKSEWQDSWSKIDGEWKLMGRRELWNENLMLGEWVRQDATLEPSAEALAARKAAVREVMQPLETLELGAASDDLAWLAPYGEAQLVGLGEGTHGVSEHAELKARLFQELAEEYGFTVILMESGADSAAILNPWLRGESQESLQDILKTGVAFWGKPFVDLLVWMREQNLAGQQPPFQIYGIDARWPSYSARVLYDLLPESEAKRTAAGLIQMDLRAWDKLPADETERARVLGEVQTLLEQIDVLPEDTPELENIRYTAQMLEQGASIIRVRVAALYSTNEDGSREYLETVDRAMAENAVWLLNGPLTGQKAAYWAHNGHLWHHGEVKSIETLGPMLAGAIEGKYKVLCSGVGEGEVLAFDGDGGRMGVQDILPPVPYQIDGLAIAALEGDQPAGYISAADLQTHAGLKDWASEQLPFAQFGNTYVEGGATYWPIPTDACDGYVFLKTSTVPRYGAGE